MVVGRSGEDGYWGQDGEEEGERGGEMHAGCRFVLFGFWSLIFDFLCIYDVIEEGCVL